jgi:hypothetical protein
VFENERFAVVTGRAARRTIEEVERQIEAYLPDGFVVGLVTETEPGHFRVEINGFDHAGWTLDGYVLPRLASGLWFGAEVFPVFAA